MDKTENLVLLKKIFVTYFVWLKHRIGNISPYRRCREKMCKSKFWNVLFSCLCKLYIHISRCLVCQINVIHVDALYWHA